MVLKYIVFEDVSGNVLAIVFPKFLIHKSIGDAIALQFGTVISAGSYSEGKAYGMSDSLCVFSRKEDADIIKGIYGS